MEREQRRSRQIGERIEKVVSLKAKRRKRTLEMVQRERRQGVERGENEGSGESEGWRGSRNEVKRMERAVSIEVEQTLLLVRREQRVERVRGWREKREVRGKSRRRRDGGR